MEKSASKDSAMIAAAQTDLRNIAALEWPRLNHKGRLRELSRRLPWSPRRVRAVYNAEPGVSLREREAADIKALTGAETEEANGTEDRALAERVDQIEAQIAALMAALAGDEMARGRLAAGAPGQPTHNQSERTPRRRSTDR